MADDLRADFDELGPERLVADHCIQDANYSDGFASAFIARINPEIF
jgi:hypothetical protein